METTQNEKVIMEQLMETVLFAAYAHRHQNRKNGTGSYVQHPYRVALNLIRHGVFDLQTLQAAILHDTVEDTDVTHDDLVTKFGEDVAHFVSEVTDNKSLTKIERKKAQVTNASKKSPQGTLVKLADKYDNLSCLISEGFPTGWPEVRVKGYFVWCWAVVKELNDFSDNPMFAQPISQFKSEIKELYDQVVGPCRLFKEQPSVQGTDDFDTLLVQYYQLIEDSKETD